MIEILMTCRTCGDEIAVDMASAVLRMDVEPRAAAELLFACPTCDVHTVRPIVGELLTLLLFVGVRPLTISEPKLDPDDVSPCHAPISRDDLLDWHEQLASIDYLAAELTDEK
jgi:hypothetical protein